MTHLPQRHVGPKLQDTHTPLISATEHSEAVTSRLDSVIYRTGCDSTGNQKCACRVTAEIEALFRTLVPNMSNSFLFNNLFCFYSNLGELW